MVTLHYLCTVPQAGGSFLLHFSSELEGGNFFRLPFLIPFTFILRLDHISSLLSKFPLPIVYADNTSSSIAYPGFIYSIFCPPYRANR